MMHHIIDHKNEYNITIRKINNISYSMYQEITAISNLYVKDTIILPF